MLTATGCFWRCGSGKYYIRRLAAAELLSPENKSLWRVTRQTGATQQLYYK